MSPPLSSQLPVTGFDGFEEDAAKRERSAAVIRSTCEEIGFFYLANHSAAQRLLRAYRTRSR